MSNGTHPLQNAAQGMLGGAIGSGLISQGTISNAMISNNAAQQQAYNAAMSRGTFTMSPRVSIEVDRVTNGYVMAVGSERMIAKDLEELQAQFIAQVVSKLVLEEGK